jgi:hypothetical protein
MLFAALFHLHAKQIDGSDSFSWIISPKLCPVYSPSSGVSTDSLPGSVPEGVYSGLMQNRKKGGRCPADLINLVP